MIRQAKIGDSITVAELAIQIWTSYTIEELTNEFELLIADKNATIFIYCVDEIAVGFAQCQLRNDYVEGTTTTPVGYLEGIFVAEGYREHGCAKELLVACEQWAKEQGCVEFASDCELNNTQSLDFHTHCGFTEINRIICFAKKI